MSEQALSNKLRGLKNFTLRDVSRIADFFDVSTDFVLGRAPFNGYELDDLEKQIDRCFDED